MSEIVIPVPAEWNRRAYIDSAKYEDMYQTSIRDPEGFWAKEARKLEWTKPFTSVKDVSYDAKNLHISWFYDGTLNVSANCLDRHLKTRGSQTAIIGGSRPPEPTALLICTDMRKTIVVARLTATP